MSFVVFKLLSNNASVSNMQNNFVPDVHHRPHLTVKTLFEGFHQHEDKDYQVEEAGSLPAGLLGSSKIFDDILSLTLDFLII